MNASNGSLVASRRDGRLLARPTGSPRSCRRSRSASTQPRSRGDREEIFGGKGASWKGAFVGGDLLVQAVTEPADGTSETLFGNFPSYSLYPPTAGLPAGS